MTAWMLACLTFSALLSIAAAIGDRLAARFGTPRRFVWMALVVVGVGASICSAIQPGGSSPAARGPAAMEEPRASSTIGIATASMRGAESRASQSTGWLSGLWMRAIDARPSFDRIAIALWAIASLALCARLLAAMLSVRRQRRAWLEIDDPVGRVYVAEHAGPAVTGVVRPRIVMPRWLLEEDSATRTLLLQHEVEHLRAGDTRVLFLAALLQALFPWNAGLLWMLRRLRLAIEIDCDHRVVRAVGSARRYGLALLAASERHALPLPIAACLRESPIDLEVRIGALTTRRRRRPLVGAAALAGIALAVTATGAWMPWPTLRVRADGAATRPRVHPSHVVPPTASEEGRVADSVRPMPAATMTAAAAKKADVDSVTRGNANANANANASDDDDNFPSMRVVVEWLHARHPDVASGESNDNRVTFVVDSLGRYVRSIADSASASATAPIDSSFAFVAKQNQIEAMPVKPLILVDGKRATSLRGSLPPERAASIELLDPEHAVARFGSDGARGAAVVTTTPTDPHLWRYAVGEANVEGVMLAHTRAGTVAANSIYIAVLRIGGVVGTGEAERR